MRGIAAVLLCAMLFAVIGPPPCAGASGDWSAEERLTVQFPSFATGLVTDVNDNGMAIAAWNIYDQNAQRTAAWAAMYDPGKGWSGGVRLDGTAYSSEVHSVAVNDNGTAVAAWTVVHNGVEHPMAAVYLAGEGWQNGAALSTEPASAIYAVDVAVNGEGEAVAAWDATVNGAYVVMASVYAPATGWGPGERLIDSANYQGDPMAGISDLGTSLVAWRERLENPDHTYSGIMRYSQHDAGGWSAQSRINDDDADQGAPVAHMEMNGPGQALLAYSCEVTGSSRSESRAAFFDGSSWHSSVALSDEDDLESSCPDVGLADDGWGMAVWAQWNGTISEYQYRTFENGTFSAIGIVAHPDMTAMNWPYIEVSDGRRVIATTLAKMDGNEVQHAYAVRYSPAEEWSAWDRLDLNSPYPVYFLVRGGIDDAGNAVAAWLAQDDLSGQNCSVWASSYAVDEVTVQETDPRDEIDALRGQLNLAIASAVAALVIAVVSLILMFRKGKRRP